MNNVKAEPRPVMPGALDRQRPSWVFSWLSEQHVPRANAQTKQSAKQHGHESDDQRRRCSRQSNSQTLGHRATWSSTLATADAMHDGRLGTFSAFGDTFNFARADHILSVFDVSRSRALDGAIGTSLGEQNVDRQRTLVVVGNDGREAERRWVTVTPVAETCRASDASRTISNRLKAVLSTLAWISLTSVGAALVLLILLACLEKGRITQRL